MVHRAESAPASFSHLCHRIRTSSSNNNSNITNSSSRTAPVLASRLHSPVPPMSSAFLESLVPGQPCGVPLTERMLTSSNDTIMASLQQLQPRVPEGLHPEELLRQIFEERGYLTNKVPSLQTAYQKLPTADQVNCYKADIVAAVRENDVETLRAMHKAGRCMSACNRYGESIIHMACRRGNRQALAFLIQCGASVGVTDDFGRTRE